MNTTDKDELTQAIIRTADEVRELLRGVVAAAPDCDLNDRVCSLLAVRRVRDALKSSKLKRRSLLPPEDNTKRRRV
jgi:hypothetical protein